MRRYNEYQEGTRIFLSKNTSKEGVQANARFGTVVGSIAEQCFVTACGGACISQAKPTLKS